MLTVHSSATAYGPLAPLLVLVALVAPPVTAAFMGAAPATAQETFRFTGRR